jgi:hypothetical protein
MDLMMENHYLQMARDHPDMLCSEAPIEVLEEASSVDEPTKFLENFFAAGYTQWLSQKYGRRVQFPKERIDNAIVVLWLRACRLHTSRILGRPNADEDKVFFSDEGLYG